MTSFATHGRAACTLALAVVLAAVVEPTRLGADITGLASGEGESLYSSTSIPNQDFKVNDLIQIIVEERGSAQNDTNTNLRRKVDLEAEISEWAELDGLSLNPADVAGLPSVDIQSEKRQEGRGTTSKRESISFVITARVVEIKPNGNLIVEGRKSRQINDEETILTVFGEVRADDIALDRTVRSARIADLKIVFSGNGPVSRNQGRTILSWLLEWLWPF